MVYKRSTKEYKTVKKIGCPEILNTLNPTGIRLI